MPVTMTQASPTVSLQNPSIFCFDSYIRVDE